MIRSYKECVEYVEKCIETDDFMLFSEEEYNFFQIGFYIDSVCPSASYVYLDGIIYIMDSDIAEYKLWKYADAKSYQSLINLLSM